MKPKTSGQSRSSPVSVDPVLGLLELAALDQRVDERRDHPRQRHPVVAVGQVELADPRDQLAQVGLGLGDAALAHAHDRPQRDRQPQRLERAARRARSRRRRSRPRRPARAARRAISATSAPRRATVGVGGRRARPRRGRRRRPRAGCARPRSRRRPPTRPAGAAPRARRARRSGARARGRARATRRQLGARLRAGPALEDRGGVGEVALDEQRAAELERDLLALARAGQRERLAQDAGSRPGPRWRSARGPARAGAGRARRAGAPPRPRGAGRSAATSGAPRAQAAAAAVAQRLRGPDAAAGPGGHHVRGDALGRRSTRRAAAACSSARSAAGIAA